MKNNYMNKSNVLLGRKLACFALVGTVAVSSLAMLTPSASAAGGLKSGREVTITQAKIVDGNFVTISDEEAAARQATRDSYWYSVELDADGNVVSPTNKTLYVPIGGTVQNGTTYEVKDGGIVYIRAAEGSTILNRYGVDVTSVDSEMSDYEKEIAKAIYENNGTSKITFNQQDQMAAEMRMLEVKQSMADMEVTGYLEQLKNDYSLAWEGHTWSVYTWVLNCRPDVSAKLLELSKTAKSYDELMKAFKSYHFTDDSLGGYTFDSPSHLMGMFLRVGESAAYDYSYHSISGAAHEYTPETVRNCLTHEVVLQYDHTPTLEEMAGKIYSELGGREAGSNFDGARIVFSSSLGISYDAATNTVVVVCGGNVQ